MVEGRKVQRVGRSTLSISLPNDWVRRVGLRRGDLVIFSQEKDGSIRMIPSTYVKPKTERASEGVVDSGVCDVPRMLERIITAHYTTCRDTIIITSSTRISESHMEEIRSAVRKLMGLGIVEEASNRIVLQCSIDHAKFPISTLVRRMYVTVSTMLNEVTQAFRGANRELARSVARRESEMDMIHVLIIRLLYGSQHSPKLGEQIGITEPIQVQSYRLTATCLEETSDSCREIANTLLKMLDTEVGLPESVGSDVASAIATVTEIFNEAVQSFQSGDVRVANAAAERSEMLKSQLASKMNAHQRDYESDLGAKMRNIEYNIRKIIDTGSMIATLVLERSSEKMT